VSWYRRIDVFVLPSLNESFSNSLMEAMACGCAVVASNVGGNPELVVHGDNGLLFEPGDISSLTSELESVLGDAALRHRLSAAAIRTIEEGYTRERSARRFGELYVRLLSGS
jgi:L-malate glycosyltransferase